MNTVWIYLSAVVLGLVVALAATSLLSGGESPDQKRNACLYEAVRAYPSWDTGNGPLLDHIDLCKGVDKTEIRDLMASFVAAANTNR